MSKKTRWGILGAARVNERIIPALATAENAELVAIASRRPGAARALQEKLAPAQTNINCHDSIDSLLQADDIDVIYLPMSNHEHTEWALKAIERGKHTLIEKPMALAPADIDKISQAAAQHRVKVMEGFMYVFHPQFQRVQDLIQAGTIGEVRFVRAFYSFLLSEARHYRIQRVTAHGGGAMWDIGPYAIHSIRSFFDTEPTQVAAFSKYINGADVSTSGVIEFGDGKRGIFDVSFECSRRASYEVIGTKGGIRCNNVWQHDADIPTISWWADGNAPVEEALASSNHFKLEIEHFSSVVLTNGTPRLSFADARANCSTINAVNEAAASRTIITL